MRFVDGIESAEAMLAEYLPVIPQFRRTSTAAVWTNSLTGVIHNGSRPDLTWNVETWKKLGG